MRRVCIRSLWRTRERTCSRNSKGRIVRAGRAGAPGGLRPGRRGRGGDSMVIWRVVRRERSRLSVPADAVPINVLWPRLWLMRCLSFVFVRATSDISHAWRFGLWRIGAFGMVRCGERATSGLCCVVRPDRRAASTGRRVQWPRGIFQGRKAKIGKTGSNEVAFQYHSCRTQKTRVAAFRISRFVCSGWCAGKKIVWPACTKSAGRLVY